MPLAVLLPEVRVVLVDRSRWKCSFLRSAAAVAGVANVRVVNAELGRLAGTEAAGTQAAGGGAAAAAVPADLVVFRALAEVTEELASTLAGLLAPGGAVVAYKGKRAKAEAEARAAAKVFAEVSVEPVQVPGLGEERSLLVLRSARGSS
jgi:16S rRNA (guanine527-N7)-methyltransferase